MNKNVYFIGIGGISMSGLALMLKKWGYKVNGSDSNKSKQTEWLEEQGIKVNIGQVEENITTDIDLVIYTAAIKEDNPELVKARKLDIECIERGSFLGEITKLYKDTIGVAGTHGKTTTSSMLAISFLEAGMDPTIQVGANIDYINGNYRVGNSDKLIIEACEYHDSFLNFKQRSAMVLNIDNDHLDYFKNMENVINSYRKFVSLLPKDGYLIVNRDDNNCYDLRKFTKAKIVTVGKSDNADWYYSNISFDNDGYPSYDVYYKGEYVDRVKLDIRGEHNVFNSLCCIAMCKCYGIDIDIVKNALLKFSGAKRRMEYKGDFNGAKVYDDYGHHPTEIKSIKDSISNMKYNKNWIVFEAHTYSRLKEHLDSFVEILKDFDNIIVMDIYAAREVNTFNINEKMLVDKIKKYNGNCIHISSYDDIVEYLSERVNKGDLVITIGAGNVTKIADLLTKK